MPWFVKGRLGVGMVAGLLVAAAAAGCEEGAAGRAKADGGDGSAAPGSLQAFDVVAVLSGDGPDLPPTNSFTLIFDRDAGHVIVGGQGSGAVVGVTSADGQTFRSSGVFWVNTTAGGACTRGQSVRYDAFDLAIVGGALHGTATGIATRPFDDTGADSFTASLRGTADTTPPTLLGPPFPPISPFDSFTLNASEPLPPSATARLFASDGAVVDLTPSRTEEDVLLIRGFAKPDVVLPAGQAYIVSLGGLVDFAGLTGPADQPLRFVSFPAPPLVLEDGFESATETVLGGAMVLKGGPLPAIAGDTSLYIGQAGVPALDSTLGRSLLVRVPRQAGETTLRFAYRTVSADSQVMMFSGWVGVGFEGGARSPTAYPPPVFGPPEMRTLASGPVFISQVGTMEVALPNGEGDTVLVTILPNGLRCSQSSVSPSVGLLVDDLRVE